LHKEVENRSDHHAPCQAINAHRRRKEDRAENYPELIQGGRERGDQKYLMRVQNADDQSAQAEQHSRDQLDAQQ
jgi:hypothetical protein